MNGFGSFRKAVVNPLFIVWNVENVAIKLFYKCFSFTNQISIVLEAGASAKSVAA